MKNRPRTVSGTRSLLDGVQAQDAVWVLAMSSVLFIVLLPFSSYVAALSFIQDEWGLNNTKAGAIYSAYLAGYAVSALFTIPLTDRVKPSHILIGSAAISVASHALFPLVAQGPISAAALRAAAGVGLVGVYMPGLRIVSERFPERGRGMAVGMFVSAFYASNSASLAGTGALMARFEWRDAYLIMALASAAAVPLAYILLRKHPRSSSQSSSGRLNLAVLGNRRARYFILGYSLHSVELYAVRVWLPAFLMATLIARGSSHDDAAVTAATIGGIALAAAAAGPVIGGVISDRWGRAASASAVLALSAVCAWSIGWIDDLPWGIVVAVVAVYGWAIAADSAIYSTAVTEVSEPEHLGSTMAAQAFLGFMGGVVGPIIFGGVLDIVGGALRWPLGFSFLGLLSVVAIFGLARVGSMSTGDLPAHRQA